ncbi:coiled-coil domain-containing protein 109 protein [Paraphysoderma sedebokerense]|nr:coiled-coil domain-containing protein 109 protein [Paraphysoderma sedebokerense]
MTEPLLELKTKLDSLSVVKSQCDALAQRSAERIVWGGLGALCLQFGLMARLTWWEYSWDGRNPICFLES